MVVWEFGNDDDDDADEIVVFSMHPTDDAGGDDNEDEDDKEDNLDKERWPHLHEFASAGQVHTVNSEEDEEEEEEENEDESEGADEEEEEAETDELDNNDKDVLAEIVDETTLTHSTSLELSTVFSFFATNMHMFTYIKHFIITMFW